MAKKNQPRFGSWLVTGTLVLAGVCYLWFSFIPTTRAIRALRDDVRMRQEYVVQTASLTQAFAQTQRDLEKTKSYSDHWKGLLPTGPSFPAFLGRVTRQADLAGASTTRFEPQTPLELGTLRSVPVVFAASGSFLEVGRMLANLEQLPERIWIDDLRLDAPREPGQHMQCELKLTVFAGNSGKSD